MYVQQVHVSEEYCIARFIILTVLLSSVSWVFLFSFSSFFYFSGSSSRLVIFSLRPIRYRTTHSNHLQHSCRVLSPPSIHPSIPPQPPPPLRPQSRVCGSACVSTMRWEGFFSKEPCCPGCSGEGHVQVRRRRQLSARSGRQTTCQPSPLGNLVCSVICSGVSLSLRFLSPEISAEAPRLVLPFQVI